MKWKQYLVVTVLAVNAITGHAIERDEEILRLNNLNIPADYQPQENDPELVKAFQGYKFQCTKEDGFNPKETKVAKKRFDDFVGYFNNHPSPSNEQVKKRLELLLKAVDSGSWKAKYVDVMWQIRETRGGPNAQALAKELTKLAEEGIPIAIQQYVESMGGFYDQPAERNRLLKLAVDRGSPEAMGLVGGAIASRSVVLRELGKQLLSCAIKQGEPQAYESLGKIAWHEGRWVDAYRLWEQGANRGCEECIGRMERFSTLRPDYRVADGMYGSNSALKLLREFYSNQLLYQISKMHNLITPAPKAMQFHITDEQIANLARKESAERGISPREN